MMVAPALFLAFLLIICISSCTAQTVSSGFPITDCGTTQGCVGFPDDTCLAAGKCNILLKFAFDPSVPDKVPVEIYGTPPSFRPQNFWIAVAFNTEQKMGGALVTECVYNNGQAGVFSSRNVPNAYANQRIMLSGVVPGNGTLQNGILGCTFTLSRARNVEGTNYDLANPFYIIAGSGPAVGSAIRQHFQRPYISGDAIIIAPQDVAFAAEEPVTPHPPTASTRPALFDKFLQSGNQLPDPVEPPSPPKLMKQPGRPHADQARDQPSRGVQMEQHQQQQRVQLDQAQQQPIPPRPIVSDQMPQQALPQMPLSPPQLPPHNAVIQGNSMSPRTPMGMDERTFLDHETVAQMIMRFIEPSLKMIIDLLNRGDFMIRRGPNVG